MTLPLRLPTDSPRAAPRPGGGRVGSFAALPLGEILVRTGSLEPANLDRALEIQRTGTAERLGTILLDQGAITEGALARALALQNGVREIRISARRAEPALIDALGADFCLRHRILPWRRAGRETVVATSRPEGYAAIEAHVAARLGPVRLALADDAELVAGITGTRAGWLVARAETRCPEPFSVRRWSARAIGVTVVGAVTALGLAAISAPGVTATALALFTVACLGAMTALRLAATLAAILAPRGPGPAPAPRDARRVPVISVLVPLLSEADITPHLIERLSELEYPADRVEFCIITEETDGATRDMLDARALPPNFRVVSVPEGSIRTKPRAMNYALDFCRGDIVAIYDAEDAPAPDQLRKVAAAFAAARPETVCLQGALTFYNARQNWLARCFTMDYAAWFRVVLPGLARLGFVIPLGGTTLFFRRDALETLGRWDAHNVTEDADLGIRLARHGWRAEIVETTTREEANCHVRPWIRQRARWLKGYALTWAVHMANPVRLLRELGLKRFLGVQILFGGTVALFLFAPLLWSLALVPFGLPHPLAAILPAPALTALSAVFLAATLLDLVAGAVGVARNGDRWLIAWVPTLMLYFPLAAFASWRAVADTAARPFFWDKTSHGHSMPRRSIPTREQIARILAWKRAA